MKKGFTLIELLAVIIILALVAVFAYPIIGDLIETTKESADLTSMRDYAKAVKIGMYNYTSTKDKEPTSIDELEIEIRKDSVVCEEAILKTETGIKLVNCRINGGEKLYCYDDGAASVCPPTEYADKSGANKPKLTDKLIPVKYDKGNWIVANTSQKWYDYNNKEWANAVILENGVTKNVGDTLNVETDIAQMYVWIPRYEYKIPEASKGITGIPDAIDIKFISADKTTATSGYNIHPGFKFGDKEVSGLWFGKFETTGEKKDVQTLFTCTNENCNQKVTIKPNYKAAYGSNAGFFYAARSIEAQYTLTNVDTHMSKYTEWTTASYLTNSLYGRCNSYSGCVEVGINNNSNLITGCGAGSGSGQSNICNPYNTSQGMMASTTGNIYGIYDMSGGSWDRVMGNALNSSNGFNNSSAGFSMAPDHKYYDSFKLSGKNNNRYDDIIEVNGVSGDYRGLFRELMASYGTTTVWYGDFAENINTGAPWFALGRSFTSQGTAGIFSSQISGGGSYSGSSSRFILIAE